MGGFYSVMSEAGQPQLSGTCVGDLISAITAVIGILADSTIDVSPSNPKVGPFRTFAIRNRCCGAAR